MTIFGFYISMAVFWLILAVIFLIIEAITIGLTTIWFAAGAFVSFILSLFEVPTTIQFVAFLAVSCCLLAFTRKIFVEKLKTGSETTNVDALIGQIGTVILDIEPLKVGQIKVKGQVWSAVTQGNVSLSKNQLVKVIAVEGVKLIVVPAD